ncbi:MAG: HipA N-terminal domain-containing protein [Planctomycetes bacterium]|jgi:serine/threonine-protein kinase HipA|nr:HipA N-terminal domain-containing protein [Planctomycetota bacterium]
MTTFPRRGKVLRRDRLAGMLEETATGFRFTYDPAYLSDPGSPPISLTLPRRAAPYETATLFPCFIALLAEGALADVQCRTLRLDEDDYLGRVLATCGGDVIGSLRVEPAS